MWNGRRRLHLRRDFCLHFRGSQGCSEDMGAFLPLPGDDRDRLKNSEAVHCLRPPLLAGSSSVTSRCFLLQRDRVSTSADAGNAVRHWTNLHNPDESCSCLEQPSQCPVSKTFFRKAQMRVRHLVAPATDMRKSAKPFTKIYKWGC